MRAFIVKLLGGVGAIVEWFTMILTALLVVLVSTNVFARYVLKVGLLWAEELSRLTFVWVVFLGAYLALRRRAHLAITIVTDRLPWRAQRVVSIVGTLLTIGFLVVLIWGGWRLVMQTLQFGRITPMLGVSAAWGYLSVPTAALLMLLEIIRKLFANETLGEPTPVDEPLQGRPDATRKADSNPMA